MKRKPVGFIYLGECHDDYPVIAQGLLGQGIESRLVDMNDCSSVQWDGFGLVNIRECRGYHCYPDFISRLDALENKLGQIPMTNSFSVIRAAMDKAVYLRGLALAGVDLIPTLWFNREESVTLGQIVATTGWHDFVVKPTVSSKSWNTYRVMRKGKHLQFAKADTRMAFQAIGADVALSEFMGQHDICIQKFMPEIFSQGEFSFVFIDNQYSHAIRKTVAADNWLAHEFFGGINRCFSPEKSQITWAEQVFTLLQQNYGDFLYARIDAIPDNQALRLLECELVVPRLFLNEGRALQKYVQGIKKRLV